jgi:hypothetical protein
VGFRDEAGAVKPQNRRKARKAPVSRVDGGRFAKGVSGNPGGRPKVPEDVRAALKLLEPRAIQRLGELMESSHGPTAIRAVEVVIERTMGKVPQALEHTGKDGKPIEMRKRRGPSPDDIAKFSAILARVGLRGGAEAALDAGGSGVEPAQPGAAASGIPRPSKP